MQALAYRLSPDCWIEKIRLDTRPPPAVVAAEPDAFDVAGLVAATAQDPQFAAEIEALLSSVVGKAAAALARRAEGAAGGGMRRDWRGTCCSDARA